MCFLDDLHEQMCTENHNLDQSLMYVVHIKSVDTVTIATTIHARIIIIIKSQSSTVCR